MNEILPPCCSAIVDTIVRPKPTPSIKFEFDTSKISYFDPKNGNRLN
ncbi:MAG: hypothetical protein ACJ0BU_08325 [Candidatus Puniceispirillales bacterium]